MDLGTRIWASELGEGGGRTEEKEEEKIPHMCESIVHRPLWGRCLKIGDDIALQICKRGTQTASCYLKGFRNNLTLNKILPFEGLLIFC